MSSKTSRIRKSYPLDAWLVSGDWKDYDPTFSSVTGVDLQSADLIHSESHPYQLLGKNDSNDIGGDFKVIKRSFTESNPFGDSASHFSSRLPWYDPLASGVDHLYCRPTAGRTFVTEDNVDLYHDIPHVSLATDLDVWGSRAIAKCIPTNPVANAQVLAGNILQKGLPRIPFRNWEGITKSAKYAGGNYLNVEFGWKPFVSDLRKLGYAIKNRDKILQKYRSESGKLLHRTYHFPEETILAVEERGDGYHPAPFGDSDYFRPDHIGRLRAISTTTIKRWFSGAFTYYWPDQVKGNLLPDSFNDRLAEANILLGARLTPEVVWELTPWSWAVNWFADTDVLVHNLSQFSQDGLVMPYAYIMEHSKTVVEYNLSDVAFKSYRGRFSFGATYTVECKQRRTATPWGFGVNIDEFTDHQLAIIAALGLTHNRGQGTINPDG